MIQSVREQAETWLNAVTSSAVQPMQQNIRGQMTTTCVVSNSKLSTLHLCCATNAAAKDQGPMAYSSHETTAAECNWQKNAQEGRPQTKEEEEGMR